MICFLLGYVLGVISVVLWLLRRKTVKKEWWEEGLPPPEYDPNSESQS